MTTGDPTAAAAPRRTPRAWVVRTWVVWLLLGVVVLSLSPLFPPTGDDWRRIDFSDHTPSGYLVLSQPYYAGHNGRVLGNLLSYALMEPWWLRGLVRAVTMVGLAWAVHRVVGSRTAWGAFLCGAGVLLVPVPVFREAVVWSTGFFYYLPPMVGVVLLVGTLAGRWPGERHAGRRWTGVATALIGAATCLFMEPVMVAALVLALGGLLATLARRRRPSWPLVGWAVGTVTGAVVMLASPGLRHNLSGEDDYYGTIGEALLGTAVVNYSSVTRSFVLSSVLALGLVLLAGLIHGVRALGRGRPVTGGLLVAGVVVVGVYAVVRAVWLSGSLVCEDHRLAGCDLPALGLDLVVTVLLLGVVAATGLLATAPTAPTVTATAGLPGTTPPAAGLPPTAPTTRRDIWQRDRTAWVGLFVATLLLLGPLLLVQPIGPRNVYGPLVTVVAMAVITLRPWVDGEVRGGRSVVTDLRVALAVGTAVWLGLVGVVQWTNAQVAAERVAILEEAVAEQRDEVVLPPFPHPDWVHGPDDSKMGHHYYREDRGDIAIRFAGP